MAKAAELLIEAGAEYFNTYYDDGEPGELYENGLVDSLAPHVAQALAQSERDGMKRAYLAGFAASSEGYNGEYPFDDRDMNPLDDADWIAMRDKALDFILSESGEPDQ